MAEVRVENVWKFYREEAGVEKRVEAVRNASFTCNDQEFLCLLGPSGCGKTSTLRMIAGLEKISKGDILIGNQRVNDLPPKDRKIAMSFESYALYPPLTVYDNIAFPLHARKYPESKIKEKIKMVTNLLGIGDILSFRPAKLSGGEQQRVSLARALVREDALITLMDEPISHLDAQLKAKMRIELKRFQKEMGLTVIYVTHDQLEALSMADKVVVMNFGEIQQIGTPDELYQQPANLFVAGFIGEPPMNFLPCTFVEESGSFFLQFLQSKLEIEPELGHLIQAENGTDQKWLFGIRPGDIVIGRKMEKSYCLEGRIYSIEPLGETSIVMVDVENQKIFVEVPGLPLEREGEAVKVYFNKVRSHIFNQTNGKALRI
ncbi:MAG: ABC transporter ATP-binding protein [Candidatus Atribacteria bacterium]|nr:ABC transporter ATP-binding protein [Candidatus Atribacteria bacterium]